MKTPLHDDEQLIRSMLLEHWQLRVTSIHFIPIGDSAYSYHVKTETGTYYLKLVDQRLETGRRTASHMHYSLLLQRLVSESNIAEVTAPRPQATLEGNLYATRGPLFFALYSFIVGETLGNAYPMSTALVQQIAGALAALHALQIPDALRQQSPQDSLTAAFDTSLQSDLAAIEHISVHDAPYLQHLREVVWPRREQIEAFLAHSHEYAEKTRQTPVASVVCHGDPWGGNIIPAPSGQLILLDWEASVIAPPERDAFVYMGYIEPDFSAFDAGYRAIHKAPIRWHADWLAYYAYRLQLRNLTNWLHNLLHEPLNEEQRENDVSMIEHHCLDRLASVEQTAAELAV